MAKTDNNPSATDNYCLYCANLKPIASLTDEHIWPRALGGGRLEQEVWRTNDVCDSCNSTSGIYVDGAFIKGVLRAYDSAKDLLENREGESISSEFCYFGTWVDPVVPNTHVADILANDVVWLIHIRQKETKGEWSKFVGGNPIDRKKYPDRQAVIVFNLSPDNNLFEDSLKAARQIFKKVEIFAPTVTNAADVDGISEVDPNTIPLIAKLSKEFLKKLDTQERFKFQIITETDFGSRLLCKLALGVGHNIIGDGFLLSSSAAKLREYFKEGDPKKRAMSDVRGISFLPSNNDGIADILKISEKWVFLVQVIDGSLILTVVSPGGKAMSVPITTEPQLIEKVDLKYKNGIIWTTNPKIVDATGPLPLMSHLTEYSQKMQQTGF